MVTEDTIIRLASEVSNLQGSFTTFMDMWRQENIRTNNNQAEMLQKIDDLRMTVAGGIRNLAEITEDLSSALVRIAALEVLRDRGMSYGWVVLEKIAYVVGGSLFTVISWLLFHAFPHLEKWINS